MSHHVPLSQEQIARRAHAQLLAAVSRIIRPDGSDIPGGSGLSAEHRARVQRLLAGRPIAEQRRVGRLVREMEVEAEARLRGAVTALATHDSCIDFGLARLEEGRLWPTHAERRAESRRTRAAFRTVAQRNHRAHFDRIRAEERARYEARLAREVLKLKEEGVP